MQSEDKSSLRRILLLIVALSAVSGTLFLLRPVLYRPWCAVEPTPCVVSSVNSLDQLAFKWGDIAGDHWSNVLQNGFGSIFFLLPFFIFLRRRRTFLQAWMDGLEFLCVTICNFTLMESVRAIVERPRPLVFASPMIDGANVNQYTSFYSGHTSFMALATLTIYFYAQRLGPVDRVRDRLLLTGAVLLTALIAFLRVWGGRHYPTDVMGGAAAGGLIAWAYARWIWRAE